MCPSLGLMGCRGAEPKVEQPLGPGRGCWALFWEPERHGWSLSRWEGGEPNLQRLASKAPWPWAFASPPRWGWGTQLTPAHLRASRRDSPGRRGCWGPSLLLLPPEGPLLPLEPNTCSLSMSPSRSLHPLPALHAHGERLEIQLAPALSSPFTPDMKSYYHP